MAELDELIGLIESGTKAYDSYASAKLSSSNVAAGYRQQLELKKLSEELAKDRYETEVTDRRTEESYEESQAELKRLDGIARDLDFDYNIFIGAVPVKDRTITMKEIYQNEGDFVSDKLYKGIESTNDLDELRKRTKAATEFNEWKIVKLGKHISEFNQGQNANKQIDQKNGIESILDYYDYMEHVNDFSEKYLWSEDQIKKFQTDSMGMKPGDDGYGIFGPKSEAAYGGPTMTVGAGPDGILNTADDDLEPLTSRGVGLMKGAPTTKDQVELESSLQYLKNQKLIIESKKKVKAKESIDWGSKQEDWWNINANQPLRNQSDMIANLKNAASDYKKGKSTKYFEYMTFDASHKFDKEGGFTNYDDVEQYKNELGLSILNTTKWGASSYYGNLEGSNTQKLLKMYEDLVPENVNERGLSSGMSTKFEGEFDFYTGGGHNDPAKKHFVQNLIMWKKSYDAQFEWTGGTMDPSIPSTSGARTNFLRLQLGNKREISELEEISLPSYTSEDYSIEDLKMLNAIIPGTDMVYNETTGKIDYDLLQQALDKLEIISLGN